MNGLAVVIVGGGAGLGLLLSRMSVERGASAVGIIDLNTQTAENSLAPFQEAGKNHRRIRYM